MKMLQIGPLRWAVYSRDGFVVIITSDRKIAERYANDESIQNDQ
jgi:hypothetical protein